MARSFVLRVFCVLFTPGVFALAQPANPCQRIHLPSTTITLFTTTDLSSKTATEGQEVQFRVDNDIGVADCLLIARGTPVLGRITAVRKAKSFSRSGRIVIGLESIRRANETGAETIPIAPLHIAGAHDLIADTLMLPGGAGLFIAPILLPLPGEQAVIRAGTPFKVNLPADWILDGHPTEPASSPDARLIVFRTPRDPLPARGKVTCFGKQLFCFGSARYLDIAIAPGTYKLRDFGLLEFHPGERVYLRQIPEFVTKERIVRTGGGIFEFFQPQMKPLEASDVDAIRKNDIRGPIVTPPRKVH